MVNTKKQHIEKSDIYKSIKYYSVGFNAKHKLELEQLGLKYGLPPTLYIRHVIINLLEGHLVFVETELPDEKEEEIYNK